MSPIKNFSITLIAILLIGIASIHSQTDFRKSNWGDNPEQVKSAESCKIISENLVRITYDCQLADIKGKLTYAFTRSNKLLRTKYLLTPEHLNTNYYIRDYNMFQDLLTQKYGEVKSQTATTSARQSIKASEWPAQLATGNLRIETKWSTSKTDIQLTLSMVDNKQVIQIDYMSKEISKLDLEEKKNSTIVQL
jgi:hypothetical protein